MPPIATTLPMTLTSNLPLNLPMPSTMQCLVHWVSRRLLLVLLLSAAACTPDVGDDLRGWAATVRSQAPGLGNDVRTVPIPTTFAYEAAGRRDPFDASKLSTELSDPDLVLRPDAGRAREVLEAFQLDSLQMVGSLRRGNKAVAVVQAERQLHQVRVGDHLGQDFGEVTAISEEAIAIAERIQDSQGKWQVRETQLALRKGGAK